MADDRKEQFIQGLLAQTEDERKKKLAAMQPGVRARVTTAMERTRKERKQVSQQNVRETMRPQAQTLQAILRQATRQGAKGRLILEHGRRRTERPCVCVGV